MFSSMLSLLGSLRGGSSFITRSLRFRSSASAYLSRTLVTPTNNKIWTWSGWLKRGTIGGSQYFFSSPNISSTYGYIGFVNDQLFVGNVISGTLYGSNTSAIFRDPSAWYHVIVSINTTNPTASSRALVYVNGVPQLLNANSPGGFIQQDINTQLNSAAVHQLGAFTGVSSYFDGYLTDVNFIDGQALTPASFGAIDSSTGVWAPRPYSGTYGTNGFYLKFGNTSSVAALGTDNSGNNNTWTVNNVSLTAGATYDSMIDVPVNYADGGNGRGNYAVLNPLRNVFGIISDAGLNYVVGSSANKVFGTIGISSGKWYWECSYTSFTSGSLGIATNDSPSTSHVGVDVFSWGYLNNGQKLNSNVFASYGAAYTAGDIIGVAFDADLGSLTFYKNNASQGVAYSGLASNIYFPVFGDQDSVSSSTLWVNFGQRPFTYTPPAGFRALNTNNLPTPSIVNGANFMAAKTYTGTAGVQSISNAVNSVSFQPDLVWIKSRTPGATSHALFDSVRGTTKYLSSNTTTTETTLAQSLTAFGADGFSLGTDTTLVNANANSYVAWQWKAGGAAVSNTQGTITSQVSANTTAGLSVVTYTGTGANATVGHGLGVAPKMIIIKNRGGTNGWAVGHNGLDATAPWNYFLVLEGTDARALTNLAWNNTAPTSSVFSIGTGTRFNGIGTYVAYCFAEIAGFSKFGSYTGNGSTDGPFVFCGFRPRFVMVKRTDVANSWLMFDTSRDTFNQTVRRLFADLANAEDSGGDGIDFLSNGFKLRVGASAITNASGGTYIFAAFAEVPSKYALAR